MMSLIVKADKIYEQKGRQKIQKMNPSPLFYIKFISIFAKSYISLALKVLV